MGNLCLRLLPLTSSAEKGGASGASQGSLLSSPAQLWRHSSLRRSLQGGSTLPSDEGGPPTLLDTCLRVAARHWDDMSGELAALPADLVQRLVEALVADGALSLGRLESSGVFGDIDALTLTAACPDDEPVGDDLVSALHRCPRLRVLDLSLCTLVTDSGLRGGLSGSLQLRHLKLNYCVALTDEGLRGLGGLTALQTLELEGCEHLTGDGLIALRRMPQLTALNLSRCTRVQSGLSSLAALSRLTSLNLGWCILLGDGQLAHLSRLTNLSSLNLSSTKVTDAGIAALSMLSSLRRLEIKCCSSVTSSCAETMAAHFTGLSSLQLERCHGFGDKGASALCTLHSLRRLGLGDTGVSDSGLCSLRSLSQLSRLDVDSCAVGDEGCRVLSRLPLLLRLDLSETDVQDSTLEALGSSCRQLQWLNLSSTQVTAAGIAHLKGLPCLSYLNMDSGLLSDSAAQSLSCLTSLTALDAFSVRLHELGAAAISRLSGLRRLELCGGCLGDSSCAHLSRLSQLTSLSLAHNSRISDAGLRMLLPGLTLLEDLNMSDTSVKTGALPELQRLRSLSFLCLLNTPVSDQEAEVIKCHLPPACIFMHLYKKL